MTRRAPRRRAARRNPSRERLARELTLLELNRIQAGIGRLQKLIGLPVDLAR